MADEAAVKELIRGAYDMHIHSEPDVLPRKFNDIVLAEHAVEAGMAGVVLKSHYICTADRASLINQMFPQIRAFGGLVLNNSMGGMNPLAVDVAGRLGNKVVWFPTVDAENEVKNITGENVDGKPQPYWMTIARAMREKGIAGDPVRVVVDGKVTHAAIQCMEVIAEYDMILATGHISPEEMLPVVKAAREAKVNRVIITHPEFPATYLDQDQQRALGKYDVMFERCFTQPYTKKVEWETGLRQHSQDRPQLHHPLHRPRPEHGALGRGGPRHLHRQPARQRLHSLGDRNHVPPERRRNPRPVGARQGLAERTKKMVIIRASNWRPVYCGRTAR